MNNSIITPFDITTEIDFNAEPYGEIRDRANDRAKALVSDMTLIVNNLRDLLPTRKSKTPYSSTLTSLRNAAASQIDRVTAGHGVTITAGEEREDLILISGAFNKSFLIESWMSWQRGQIGVTGADEFLEIVVKYSYAHCALMKAGLPYDKQTVDSLFGYVPFHPFQGLDFKFND